MKDAPSFENLSIKQSAKPPTADTLARLSDTIVLLPAARGAATRLPHQAWVERQLRALRPHRANEPLASLNLPNRNATRMTVALLREPIGAFALLELARKLVRRALEPNPARIGVVCAGLEPALAQRAAEALTTAALAARAAMPKRQTRPQPPKRLRGLHLFGAPTLELEPILAQSHGNALARWLTQLPPNELTPMSYRKYVQKLARKEGWRVRVLDERSLARLGAGAFLAVSQGSADRDAALVHLRYQPAGLRARTPRVALVGKGICFDTGGTNLKAAKHMQGMHGDMQGSAVALGTLLALSRMRFPHTVDSWLALAQNHIGPKAYKPHDVVRALDGTTIEVMHTDAEGRMVLADALALAAREKPDCIVDYATLTGACVYALSTRMSGAFTNRDAWIPRLIRAGRDSGERVWPFPMEEDFDQALESDIADVKQCTLEGEADHILAARFLQRFVPDRIPWVHVDLAAGEHKGGLAHVPTDVTGFGVRYTLHLLLQEQILDDAEPHTR